MERFNSFSSDQIILTKRQVSMIMASMLLFCLFVFIVGFFLGKRTLIEDYSSRVTKEALHDQIDFLLTTQSLQNSQEDVQQEEIENTEIITEKIEIINSIPTLQAQDLASFAHEKDTQEKLEVAPVQNKEQSIIQEVKLQDELCEAGIQSKKQYAQLIGFGTKKAAQAFVARLKKHDVPVILKTVMSKTASGKQRTWYQAITPTYESCQELQAEVAKIKRLEHIRDKDIKIVHVK